VTGDAESEGPLEILLKGSRDLLHPEEIVADATRDLVKEEVRRHLDQKLRENPELARALKSSVKDLLDARAREYAALLRLTAAMARLGFAAAPEAVRGELSKDLATMLSKEFGNLVDRTL